VEYVLRQYSEWLGRLRFKATEPIKASFKVAFIIDLVSIV
jgi:hypothetical protein